MFHLLGVVQNVSWRVIILSKVPKEMGKKVQKELQDALDEWTSYVETGAEGYYRKKETQKIEVEQ